MSRKNPHVLIVGGGLGGLTLAQCLRKRGISFEIFERDPDWRTSGWCIYIHRYEVPPGPRLNKLNAHLHVKAALTKEFPPVSSLNSWPLFQMMCLIYHTRITYFHSTCHRSLWCTYLTGLAYDTE